MTTTDIPTRLRSCWYHYRQPKCLTGMLLGRFPKVAASQEHGGEQPIGNEWDFHAFASLTINQLICDRCAKLITSWAFHCNVCEGGNFDLCAECLMSGRHCPDKEHLLVEIEERPGEGIHNSGRYY
jgi:hypothetical protein